MLSGNSRTVPPVIALSFHSSATEDVDHEALWLVSVIKVQFWINRVACKIVFQPLVPDIGAPLHEEHVIAVRQESIVDFEFYLRNVTGGMRTPWKLLCVSVTECTGGGQVT